MDGEPRQAGARSASETLREHLSGLAVPLEEALQRERTFFSAVLAATGALVTVLDRQGRIVTFNRACEEATGYSFEEVQGKCFWDFLLIPDEVEPVKAVFARLQAGQFPNEYENYWVAKDGNRRLIHWSNSCLTAPGGVVEYLIGTGTDVTEQRRAQQEREILVAFLRLVNESQGKGELIRSVATFVQQQSGCEAVGVRLKDGDDFPYFEARGFPKEFVRLENQLCERDKTGQLVRDSLGCPIIECMCGNVICGRFDPSQPFFTAQGSFWTNCTTELLANSSEADRQTRTRNRCNDEGYESVALLPLRVGNQRLGLLQLNDRRKGFFSPASIALWERLTGHLAVALAKTVAEEEAQRLLDVVAEERDRLRVSEERMRQAVRAACLGVFEHDHRTDVIQWSPEMRQIYGIGPNEPVNIPTILNFYHPDDRESIAAAIQRAHDPTGDGVYSAETRIVRRDGSVRWLIRRAQTFFDNEAGARRPVRTVGVAVDITERKLAEEAIQEAHDELEIRVHERTAQLRHEQRTLEHMLQSSDHERQLIAYEIHDGLAQYLTGAVMQLQMSDHLRAETPDEASKAFDAGMAMVREGLAEARRLISGVRPPILDESGVVAAVAHLVYDFRAHKGPKVEFHSKVDFGRLDPILENAIYRIAQEGLTNAWKYSQSTQVSVGLVQHGDQVRITIRDHGIGFDPKVVEEGRFGLEGIRERARLLGGKAVIDSRPGKGTRIVADLPIVLRKENGE